MHLDIPRGEGTDCPAGESFACSTGDFGECFPKDTCEPGLYRREDSDPILVPTKPMPSKGTDTKTEETASGVTLEPSQVTDSDADSAMNSRHDTTLSTTKKEKTSKVMTDSGITHTIPNNNRVTITKHTLIITDKTPTPIPTIILSSPHNPWSVSSSSSEATPTETLHAADSSADATGTSPSTGMIAGVAIGGAVALGICTFLLIRYFRRRRRGVSAGPFDERFSIEEHGDNDHEKNYLQALSPHSTGTQGNRHNRDPFAPFGGRVDKPNDPLRPPSGTFEMDGTSTAPAELPTETYSRSSTVPQPNDEQRPVQPTGPVDPRANLNASITDRRQNTYVNHWNQYRNLGGDREPGK